MVYVDNFKAPYGGMVMCHMIADTRKELFEMVHYGENLRVHIDGIGMGTTLNILHFSLENNLDCIFWVKYKIPSSRMYLLFSEYFKKERSEFTIVRKQLATQENRSI